MRKDRRFRILLNRFQGKLLLRFVGYWLVYQICMWNFLLFWQLLEEGKGNPIEQYARFFGAHYPMLFCFAALVPFFAWDAARLTHRVAGPIHRIRQTLQAVTADQPIRPVKLRDGDHLGEVVDDLNAMLESLKRRGLLPTTETSGASEATDL